MVVSQKVTTELPYNPVIPQLAGYPKELTLGIQTRMCTKTMFIAALFTVIKMQKQPKCPWMGEWMNKM